KGLSFKLGYSTTSINGDESVKSITLNSGEELDADAVLLSTGVRPRLELTENTDIKINKGIIVDDFMETSVKNIYAAGDISEHNNICYGLWLPAKEQGFGAGQNMSDVKTKYSGSKIETRMKVTGISLFSAGDFNKDDVEIKIIKHDSIYKKIVFKNNILYGAISLGDNKFAMTLSKIFEEKLSLNEYLKTDKSLQKKRN
ncbi:MAG: FAD-dependent oxidoreductase, partial [Bacteroidales bacterium]|nr:FAD-dependent oxidoreductase [Bacteroidales bacterium]